MKATKHDWLHLHHDWLHLHHDWLHLHHDYEAHPNSSPFGRHKYEDKNDRVIPEDRSTNAWMAASCKKEWETFCVSNVYMEPRKVVGKREDLPREDLPRQHTFAKTPTRWGRFLQVIHEEVWNDIQRSLPVGRARADS